MHGLNKFENNGSKFYATEVTYVINKLC